MRFLPALGFWLLAPVVLTATSADAAEPNAERPVVRVVYFVPTDRTPEPEYQARLDRVMQDVQKFYKDGMAANGYGAKTFELDRDPNGALRFLMVSGKLPMREYGRNDAGKVRREVKEALAKQNIDIDRETIIIFQLLLDWQGDKAIEVGPYVGGGGPRSGTAWVYDDAKLDPRLLSSKKPGGYYHGPCSIGDFNTHYIGGVAHELGHALGLPHDCEQAVDRPRYGRSLMGGGNHTYGREQRGAGKGAFLSAASALPLSVHPLFTGKRTTTTPEPCQFVDLKARYEDGSIVLTGRLQGSSPPVGLVARNDPTAVGGDYDAVGWTCPVDAQGAFRLKVGELTPGEYDLRLAAYSQSGDARHLTIRYRVGQDKRPDLQPFQQVDQELSTQRPDFLTAERRRQNLLTGGTFEQKDPKGWTVRAYRPERDAVQSATGGAHEGKRSIRLQSRHPKGNDIQYVQKVDVKPNTRYLLCGWARTQGVTLTERGGTTGANLGIAGDSKRSRSLTGDQDWTYLTVIFDTGTRTSIEVGARLGHNGSVAQGSAGFDDLHLLELGPSPAR